MTLHDFRPSRRAFIAGAGLVIGFSVDAERLRAGRSRAPTAAATIRCRS